jgi:hypothetical protein
MHSDANEIKKFPELPEFLRRDSTKPAATQLDQLLNLLGIAPDKGSASATVAELLIQKGRPYHAAVGFDLADDDAQRLACTLDTHYSDTSAQPLSYSAAADMALALPVATGADRTALIAGLIRMMLMASRRSRIGGLISFVHQMFPSGSSVAFTTMLPVEKHKDLHGFTWCPNEDPEGAELGMFLADAEDNGRNIYLCTSPVDAEFCGVKPADKDTVLRIHGLLDFDRKSLAKGMDEAEACSLVDVAVNAAITMVGVEPAARLWSGNGVHLWFKVPSDLDREVWADVCAATGSDAVPEPSRIARAPGSWNVPTPDKRNNDGYRPRLAYLIQALNSSAQEVNPVHLADTFPSRKNTPKARAMGSRTGARHGPSNGLTADEIERLEAMWPLIQNAAAFEDLPDQIREQAEVALLADKFLLDRYHGHVGPLVDRFGTPRAAGFMDGDRSAATMSLITIARRSGLSLEVTAALAVTHETGELLPGEKHDEAGRKRQFGRCWSKAAPPEEGEVTASSRGGGTALRRAEDAILALPGAELWRSRTGRFITLPTEGGVEHFDLESAEARNAIFVALRQLPDRTVHLPPKSVIDLAETLYAVAHAAPEFSADVRSAPHAAADDDFIYVNMANGAGEVIEVTPTGYQIIPGDVAPVRFPRRSNLRPLPFPAAGMKGSDFLQMLGQHIALPQPLSASATDTGIQAQAGVMLFLTSAMRRDGEVAHLLLTGPAGAGKTTTALRLKDLCDPTNPPLSAAPRDILGLVALAKGQGITTLDNTSNVPPETADMLCGFATGTALTARQLYSNGDLYSAEVLAPVMFTTVVPDLSNRPDLLSRMARVVLEPRTVTAPKSLLDDAWQKDRPALLGAFLDLLAGGLAGWRAVATEWASKPLERLAGPLIFAEAAARSMGWEPNLLIEAMRESWREQQTDAASGDPVVAALLDLMSKVDLLTALTSPLGTQGKLPIRTPQGLGQAIARLDPGALADLGLAVTHRRINGRKVLTITKTSSDKTGADSRTEPDPFSF